MLRALISNTARVTRSVSRSRSNTRALFKRTLCSPKSEESDAEREVMFEKIEDTLNKLGFDRVKQHLERSSVNTIYATSQSAQGSKKKIVDKVRITLVSGSGGHGCVSFDRQRHKRVGAPNGGDGGRGGNVMFVVQSALPDLGGLLTAQQLTAPRGENGAASNRRGKNGADLRIGVPPGTLITEYVKRNNSDEHNEDLVLRPAPLEDWARDLEDMTLLERYPPGHDYIWTDGKLTRVSELTAQQERVIESRGNKTVARKLTQEDKHVIRLGQGTLLEKEGDFYLACRGGRGGLGNAHFASSINRSPETMTRGQIGETKSFVVELNLIADVGLIGFPNAGKSTLLQRLTRATPKIAPYPFTTLAPQLGTVMYRDSLGTQVRVADLPGLIQSAHLNRGLGIEFLRHVTRAKTLAVVLDMAGSESRSPWQDFEVLCSELEHYRPGLSKQIKLVIANKMDLPEASKHLRAFRAKLKERSDLAHLTLWALSAKEGGLELEDLAEHLKEVVHGAELEPEFKATNLLPHSEKLSREVHEQELLGFTDAERSLPDPELDGQKSSEPPKTKKKVASKKIKKINKSSK